MSMIGQASGIDMWHGQLPPPFIDSQNGVVTNCLSSEIWGKNIIVIITYYV